MSTTSVNVLEQSSFKCYGRDRKIFVNPLTSTAYSLSIYDIGGGVICEEPVIRGRYEQLLDRSGIYVLRILSTDGEMRLYKVHIH